MKKLLFILAISGLAFTSCNNSSKENKAESDVHQHDGCEHDHATEAKNHQEEFTVDTTANEATDAALNHEHDHDHGHDHQH